MQETLLPPLILNHPSTAKELPPPWGFWSTCAWQLLAVTAALLVNIVIALFSNNEPSLTLRMTFSGTMLGMLFIGARFAGWKAREYFAIKTPRKPYLLPTCACFVLEFFIALGSSHIFNEFEVDVRWLAQYYQEAYITNQLLWLWYSVAIEAPLLEEMIFRGFIFRGWSSTRLGAGGAIVLSSLLFGLIHLQYSWLGMCMCSLTGATAGWLRWRFDSIFPSILLHAITNLSALTYCALYS